MKVSVEAVQIVIPPPKQARSAGIHVSSIIRAIAAEQGILKQEVCEELSLVELKSSTRFDDPVVALRVSLGLAWEDFYIREVLEPEGVLNHPPEKCVDAVYMSLDGEQLSQVIVDRRNKWCMKVHEVKLTWKSTNTVGTTEAELRSQFMWMAQIKAYCKATDALHADLHVFFVNGDYSYPLQPLKLRYHLEFEQQEIDDNWDLLTNYRDYRLQMEASSGQV